MSQAECDGCKKTTVTRYFIGIEAFPIPEPALECDCNSGIGEDHAFSCPMYRAVPGLPKNLLVDGYVAALREAVRSEWRALHGESVEEELNAVASWKQVSNRLAAILATDFRAK